MKLPRDLSASDVVRGLERLGYVVTRQRGSHIRLTTSLGFPLRLWRLDEAPAGH